MSESRIGHFEASCFRRGFTKESTILIRFLVAGETSIVSKMNSTIPESVILSEVSTCSGRDVKLFVCWLSGRKTGTSGVLDDPGSDGKSPGLNLKPGGCTLVVFPSLLDFFREG